MVLGGDESELTARIAEGDVDAFRTIAERHGAALLAVARSVLRDEAEAEDVVQETLVKLWRSGEDVSVPEGGIGPWLKRVARNLAIDRQRRARKFDVVEEVPDTVAPAVQQSEIEDRERKAAVDAAIDELPDRQRSALLLFHHEGFSVAEIALSLAVSEDAAESLLARARRGLKARLESSWRALVGLDEDV